MIVRLIGGPPWGLRLGQDERMQPAITQVLSGGKADQAGLQIRDRIKAVNGRKAECVTQTHSLLQKSRGQVEIEIDRFSCFPQLISSPPKNENIFDGHHYRGATQDKKRFFEKMIEVDECPSNQIAINRRDPSTKEDFAFAKFQANPSIPSEQNSTIGYDSVFADLGGESSLEGSLFNRPLSSSIDSEVNGIFRAVNGNPGRTMYDGYGYGEHDLEEIIEQQMAAAKAAHQSQTWGMRAEINNAGPAEGSIEIPGRRSVAELANNLAGRLEVKAPNGQSAGRPRTPGNPGIPLGRVLDENPNHEINDPNASKEKAYLGRVLDGPVDPRKYFQGVPPPSTVQVASPPVQRKTPNIAQSFLKAQSSARPSHSLSSNFRNGVHAGLSNNGFADPNNSPGFYRRQWGTGQGSNGQPMRNTTTVTYLTSVTQPQSHGSMDTVSKNTYSSSTTDQLMSKPIQESRELETSQKPEETSVSNDLKVNEASIQAEKDKPSPPKTVVVTKSSVSYTHPTILQATNKQKEIEAKVPLENGSTNQDQDQRVSPNSCYSSAHSSVDPFMTPMGDHQSRADEPTPTPSEIRHENGERIELENTNTESSETSLEETKRLKIPPPTAPKPSTPLHFAPPVDPVDEDNSKSTMVADLVESLSVYEPVKSRTHHPDVHQARTTPVIFDRLNEEASHINEISPVKTMDLESSTPLQKQFTYTTNSADHYGTIRRGMASLVSPSTPSNQLSLPRLSSATNDSGFEENLRTPNHIATPAYDSLSVNTFSRPVSDEYNETTTTSTAASSSSADGLQEKRPIFEEDMSNWYRDMYKRMHKVDANDSILKYYIREGNSPTAQSGSNLGRERPWTPSARLETAAWGGGGEGGLEGETREIEPRRARSVGRTLDHSSTQQVSAANRYALERMRSPVPHFHLPSFRLDPQPVPCSSKSIPSNCVLRRTQHGSRVSSTRPPSSPPCLPIGSFCTRRTSPSAANICLRCGWPRKDPSWREIDEMYDELGSTRLRRRPYASRSTHDLQRNAAINDITKKLDETAAELERFVEDLDRCWKRSLSSPSLYKAQLTKSASFNPGELAELTRLTREEQMYRQKAERLTEELEAQRSRRHGYVPSAAPALQKNVERFTGLLNEYGRDSPSNRQQSASPMQNGRRVIMGGPPTVITCTCIYKFSSHNDRELPLNKGDIVRIHREIDSNWLEGERNGRIGIFPRSYVQIESEFERTPVKYRAVYPFTARNSNEMSLKVGQLVTFRREIDANWMEGTNNLGEIGIFPSCYVRRQEDTEFVPTAMPDRPKTPHNAQQQRPPEYHESTPEEPTLCLPHPVPDSVPLQNGTSSYMNTNSRDSYPQAKSIDRTPQYSTQAFPAIDKTRRYNDYDEDRSEHEDKLSEWSNRKKAALENASTGSNPANFVPQNSETYRALYPYIPVNEDELELQVNDIVFVVEKCDDGWFIGTLLRTGQFGTFPGNYVVRH